MGKGFMIGSSGTRRVGSHRRYTMTISGEEMHSLISYIMVSVIEYACTVWAPNSAQDINRIEMIQRRAA